MKAEINQKLANLQMLNNLNSKRPTLKKKKALYSFYFWH